MTENEFLKNRISLVRQYLTIVKNFEAVTVEKLQGDIILRGAVERYLYLAI